MLRKLGASLAVLAMSVALLGLGLPASAGHQISVDADGVTVADNTGDSKDSPSCLIDDRQQDPFIPRPPTNVVVGNCDQPVPQLDVQSFSFKHKDGLLKDPAGNDGIYGTADDAIGLDQVPGTADDTPAANITRTVPGLEATWTVGKAWPALGVLKATPDREGDQPLDGLTVYTYWRDLLAGRRTQ